MGAGSGPSRVTPAVADRWQVEQKLLGGGRLPAVGADQREVAVGGQSLLLSRLQQLAGKGLIALFQQPLQQGVVGVVGLDQHLTAALGPAGPPGDLEQQPGGWLVAAKGAG